MADSGSLFGSATFVPSPSQSRRLVSHVSSMRTKRNTTPSQSQTASEDNQQGEERSVFWRFAVVAVLLGLCQQIPVAALTAAAPFWTIRLGVRNLFLYMVSVLFVPAPLVVLLQIWIDGPLDICMGVRVMTMLRLPANAAVLACLLVTIGVVPAFSVLMAVSFLVGTLTAAFYSSSMQIVAPAAASLPALVQCGTGVAAVFVVLVSKFGIELSQASSDMDVATLFFVAASVCVSVAAFFVASTLAGWLDGVFRIIEAYRRFVSMERAHTLPKDVDDFPDFLDLLAAWDEGRDLRSELQVRWRQRGRAFTAGDADQISKTSSKSSHPNPKQKPKPKQGVPALSGRG